MIACFFAAALAGEAWQRPSAAIEAVLRAPELPATHASPDGATLLLLTPVRYPPLSDRSTPPLKLAGERVDPRTGGPWGVAGSVSPVLVHVADATQIPLSLPADARVLDVAWAADGDRFALTVRRDDRIDLWVGDTEGALSAIADLRLVPVLGSAVAWLPDQRRLLVKRVDPSRGAPPGVPAVPEGPHVLSSSGAGASSTYEARDLLVTAADDAAFTYWTTAGIAIVDPSAGTVTGVGAPGPYADVHASPDGRYLLVNRLVPPWSHEVAHQRFAHDEEVWDLTGRRVATVASLPTADAVPIQGVSVGPRDMGWRPSAPATLVWREALDGGDPGRKAEERDRVLVLKAPFAGAPREIWRGRHRVQRLWWGRGGLALVQEYERERRWRHVHAFDADRGPSSGRVLFALSVNDGYADPGEPVVGPLPNGARTLLQDGDDVLFSGQGSTPTGDRPFLDRRSLKTGKVERLFQSGVDVYETVLRVVDAKAKTLLIRRESPALVPNVHEITRGAAVIDRAVTAFTDPTPQLRGITKRIVTYARADGTPLSFRLYLPAGYEEGTPLPTVVSAYPREFSDPGTAGQVSGSERTFERFIGPTPLFFLLEGYAVLMNAAMPVVGDPDTAYDSFVEQLVADAEAAVGKAVSLGVTDPARVGVMGHSHGALMTATLLAHSGLFKAGIARSGAYNQTIRPFGFQNERRTLWEAREAYINNSVTMFVPRIKAPLLLIHGQMDENPGTLPFQSERLFEAVRGAGGTARLVMLPFEGHGYVSRESTEQVLWEQLSWFDRYVKGP